MHYYYLGNKTEQPIIMITSNQISPFEYISILVSIILGLGITQILSAFADLLYNYKKVKFYWPQLLWVLFILFLQIQDWFVFYQLERISVWNLPLLLFVLAYPITLFICSKMLLPTNKEEERIDMKAFYYNQFPVIFLFVAIGIVLSILFNVLLLNRAVIEQSVLLAFLLFTLYLIGNKGKNEILHKLLSIAIIAGSLCSLIFESDYWIVK